MKVVKTFTLFAITWIAGIIFAMAVSGNEVADLKKQVAACQELADKIDTAYMVAEDSYYDAKNLGFDMYYLKINSTKFEGDFATLNNIFESNRNFYNSLSIANCYQEIK